MKTPKTGSLKARRVAGDIATYIFLSILCLIWLVPFFWLLMQSFRAGHGQFISTFLPEHYTLDNYKAVFKDESILKLVFALLFIKRPHR